jgi:hypothetical protein
MQSLVRLAIILGMLAIIVSLGSALVYLVRDKGDSRKMVRALTWRVSLSVALFALLMLAWYAGLIAPHGLQAH